MAIIIMPDAVVFSLAWRPPLRPPRRRPQGDVHGLLRRRRADSLVQGDVHDEEEEEDAYGVFSCFSLLGL